MMAEAIRYTPKGFPYRIILWGNRTPQRWAVQVEGMLADGKRAASCPPINKQKLADVLAIAEGVLEDDKGALGPAKPFTPAPDHKWMEDPRITALLIEKATEKSPDDAYGILSTPARGIGSISVREHGGTKQTANLNEAELREFAAKLIEAADRIAAERNYRFGEGPVEG